MKFITAMLSNVGGRGNNEDYVDYFYNENSYGAWITADGLGGHLDGEVASRLAVETSLEEFSANSALEAGNIERVFIAANDAVMNAQENQRPKSGMRTTMVGLFTNLKEVLWAHVGDSRLYFFRKGMVTAQTKDHSVSQMAVSAGEIVYDEIRFHEDRNKLLRVLGNNHKLKVDILETPLQLNSKDAFLLCTDGFWEYVYELEMEIDLAKANSPEEWLNYMYGRLYKRAEGNFDNFSAIAVFVE